MKMIPFDKLRIFGEPDLYGIDTGDDSVRYYEFGVEYPTNELVCRRVINEASVTVKSSSRMREALLAWVAMGGRFRP